MATSKPLFPYRRQSLDSCYLATPFYPTCFEPRWHSSFSSQWPVFLNRTPISLDWHVGVLAVWVLLCSWWSLSLIAGTRHLSTSLWCRRLLPVKIGCVGGFTQDGWQFLWVTCWIQSSSTYAIWWLILPLQTSCIANDTLLLTVWCQLYVFCLPYLVFCYLPFLGIVCLFRGSNHTCISISLLQQLGM